MTLTSYNGIDIDVDERGTFSAVVGEVTFRNDRLDGLKTLIENELKSTAKSTSVNLKCIVMRGNDAAGYSVEHLTIIGMHRGTSAFKFAEKFDDEPHYVLPDTPANERLLRDYALAKVRLYENYSLIKPRELAKANRWLGGRIDASKYSEELKNLKGRYERALLASTSPTAIG